MARYLTAGQVTQAAAAGSAPVLLIRCLQRVPGLSRAYYWASRHTTTAYSYTLSGQAYRADLASIPDFRYAMTSEGGVGEFSRGQIVLVNVKEDGTLQYSDALDNGLLDGAELDFWFLFLTGSEANADRILLGGGEVLANPYDLRQVTLDWLDRVATKYRVIPTARFNATDYPYMPYQTHGRIKPVVLGDMTGQAFDLTGMTDADWRHIPCPLIDGSTPGYYIFDSTSGGEREELIVLSGVPCELISTNRTLGNVTPVVAGDPAPAQLSLWTFAGVTVWNTNAGIGYWKLTNSGTTRTVSVYKNSDGAAGNLVAQGSRTGNGSITLSAQNDSGMSGTVTVTYTGDDTTLAANTVTFALNALKLWTGNNSVPPNLVEAWVRPYAVFAATSVTNAEYARSDDLDEYATIAAGGSLELGFPGLEDAIGTYAGAVAANAILYIVHSASAGDTIDFDVEQSNVSIFTALATVTGTSRAVAALSFGATIDALNDVKNLTVLIDNCTPATAYIHRVALVVRVNANAVLNAWKEQEVYRTQSGFTESTGVASDDYQDGGYIDPPGTTERSGALQHPADQLEAIFRNKNWGLGLRAPSYTNPSASLTAYISPSDTGFTMTAGKAVQFTVGDTVLVNYELARVTAISGTPTESGDASSQMSAWSFTGMSTSNTNGGILYWKILEGDPGVYQVSVYKDSAGTQLVAQSAGAGNGSHTLVAQGGSGLSGSVTVTFVADDTTVSANTLTFNTITCNRGIDGSIRAFHNDGDAVYIVPTGGQVAIGSFRAAVLALQHTTGAELITNGDCEVITYTGTPTEAGDTGTQLASWSFTGMSSTNTVAGILYWKLTDTGGTRTVSIYKTSAMSAAALVAQGSRVGDGSVTLTEQNSSGLSGSVDVTYTGNDTDSGNTLTFSTGIVTGWTENDPDSKITLAPVAGYARRYGQQVTRSATGGNTYTSFAQDITTVTGTWYKLSFWAKVTPAADIQVILQSGPIWQFAATTSFQHFEGIFKAWTTTITVRLLTGAAANDVAIFDEISCKKLTGWLWDHALTDEVDSRSWLDDSCKDGAIRVIQDSSGRSALRILYPHRTAVERSTWNTSVITRNGDGSPALRITQTARESIYTGVRVRYAYDHVLKDYRDAVYIVCEQVSTGQAVTGWSGSTITVASTTNIFPANRWDSGSLLGITDFGLSGTTVTLTGATLQTNGVAAGDWFWIAQYTDLYGHLAIITSVDSETQLTVKDIGPTIAITSDAYCAFSCFPTLYRTGGRIWIPYVAAGVGWQSATEVSIGYQSWFDTLTFGTGSGDPAVGDTVWKLVSDSEDHSAVGGNRDQTLLLRENRERQAMVRVARYGQPNDITVNAPRIQDRETAIALRNYLFDYHQRHYIFEVTTDLSTIASEIGDQITLTHDLVPGGTMATEIISQELRLSEGRITYMLKEVKGIPR